MAGVIIICKAKAAVDPTNVLLVSNRDKFDQPSL